MNDSRINRQPLRPCYDTRTRWLNQGFLDEVASPGYLGLGDVSKHFQPYQPLPSD